MKATSYTEHAYNHPEDMQACTDLLRRARPPQRAADYPSVVDLYEELSQPETQAHTRLWREAGQVVAFAFVSEYNNLSFECDPACGAALEEAVLAWAIPEARRLAAERHEGEPTDTTCRSENTARIALLERHGLVRLPERGLHFSRPLDTPLPPAQLPAGFTIRPTLGAEEAEAWVALHRAAFGTEYMTVAYRLEMLSTPGHDADLDLVSVAPDGRLAAYCVGWYDAQENEMTGCLAGYTDPVATHPDFQRRGLSKALLCAALHRLQAHGLQEARLGTSDDNLAMQAAARAAGFTLSGETWRYRL
jgi:ribosomal protein S18 acetylase RimI-like enzyme